MRQPAQREQLLAGIPDDVEMFLARRRRPRQRLDFAFDVMTDRDADALRVRSVAILVDDLVAHVAARGTLTSNHGTKMCRSAHTRCAGKRCRSSQRSSCVTTIDPRSLARR